MASETKTSLYRSIGGSSIDVILQFPFKDKKDVSVPLLYLGSAITVSYSVYRAKSPVYKLGDTTPNGFAIGKKTVAGSIVKAVMEDDEMSNYINDLFKQGILATDGEIVPLGSTTFSRELFTVMKDDLTAFNIILLFSSEYHGETKQEIIYGANIVNNGQVMSAMDLFTETTLSFVAKDVRPLHSIDDPIGVGSSIGRMKNPAKLASKAIFET